MAEGVHRSNRIASDPALGEVTFMGHPRTLAQAIVLDPALSEYGID
jgi:hypothetical protein